MKALNRIAVVLVLLVPLAASASCFFVYGGQNRLLYRSTVSPVDLSKPISEGLRARFPGAHLVMIPDESACPDLLNSGEAQIFASIGFSGPAARSTSGNETVPVSGNRSGEPLAVDEVRPGVKRQTLPAQGAARPAQGK